MPYTAYFPGVIDKTKLDGVDLTDFVFKIEKTDPLLATIGNGGLATSSDGYDIGVRAGDDSIAWDFRLLEYNAATGYVKMHARAPTATHAVDTPFRLTVGDATITTDQSSTGTYSALYRAAYPFKNGIAPDGTDYTANANNASSITGSATVNGQSFNGTSDNVVIPDDVTLSFLSNTPMRLAANVMKIATGRADGIIHKYDVSGLEYVFGWFSDDKLYAWLYDAVQGFIVGRTAPASVINLGTKQRVVMEYDGGTTSAAVKIFVDGVQVDTANAFGLNGGGGFQMRDTAQPLHIGDGGAGLGGTLYGIVQDMFVMEGAGPGWNVPEANAFLDPSTFVSFSAITYTSTIVTPSPAVATWVVNAPTLTLGAVSVAPSPAIAAWVANAPTVTLGAVSVTPGPAISIWAVNAPTLTLGAVSVTPNPAVATWTANNPAVSLGAVSVTPDPAVSAWTALDLAVNGTSIATPLPAISAWVVNTPTLNLGALVVAPLPASRAWVANAPLIVLGGVVLAPDAAIARFIANDPTVSGGASTTGGVRAAPRRIKIPGYVRGSMAGVPSTMTKEFEKLQRAQPNSDTVIIQKDYSLEVIDRMLLVDTSVGDVTITLLPADTRFALAIAIAKISEDSNRVIVRPARGDGINDAAGLTWDDAFVAYSMHPDGANHWWLEGFNERITPIAPGTYTKIIVNRNGRVTAGNTHIEEQDLGLSDVTTNNATVDRHGFLPKLSGDRRTYLNGEGEYAAAVNFAHSFLFSRRR